MKLISIILTTFQNEPSPQLKSWSIRFLDFSLDISDSSPGLKYSRKSNKVHIPTGSTNEGRIY
jgi:hypothetical protein